MNLESFLNKIKLKVKFLNLNLNFIFGLRIKFTDVRKLFQRWKKSIYSPFFLALF